jgi:hypothetical protein
MVKAKKPARTKKKTLALAKESKRTPEELRACFLKSKESVAAFAFPEKHPYFDALKALGIYGASRHSLLITELNY